MRGLVFAVTAAALYAARAGCTINFENLPVGTAVSNQYAGVTFSTVSPPRLCPEPAMRVQAPASGTTSSGTNCLRIDVAGCNPDFSPDYLVMTFACPQTNVSFNVGDQSGIPIDIRYYDSVSGGSLLGSFTVNVTTAGVHTPVAVTGTGIFRIEVEAQINGFEAIDDLSFDSHLTLVCPAPMTVPCQGPAGAVVNFAATAFNCAAPTSAAITYSPAPPALLPIGDTFITCTAISSCETQQCKFLVTVSSNCTDCISNFCPANLRLPCTSPSGVEFSSVPAPVFTNLCSPSDLYVWSNTAAGFYLDVGSHSVTWVASNSLGQAKTCSFTVEIFVPPTRISSSRSRLPGGFAIAFTWLRSCQDLNLEWTPSLGGGGGGQPDPGYDPVGGIPIIHWQEPDPTNNLLRTILGANIPLPPVDPSNTSGIPRTVFLRLSNRTGLITDFSQQALGSPSGPLRGLTASNEDGSPLQIVDFNGYHALRFNDAGLCLYAPANIPHYPFLFSGSPMVHELTLGLIRDPNAPPPTVGAFDIKGQLVHLLTVSNTIGFLTIQSRGYPLGRIELNASPNSQAGLTYWKANPNFGDGFSPLNPCAGGWPTGAVSNPWTNSGIIFTSRTAVGSLDPNTYIEGGPEGNGYHVQYSTEIELSNCCRQVQIELVQNSGLVVFEAQDSAGSVLGKASLTTVGTAVTVPLGPFEAPICKVVVTSPNDLTRILRICCDPQTQTNCLPSFDPGTNANPYTVGSATFAVTGGILGPSSTYVLTYAGYTVLDLGTETLASLLAPCEAVEVEVISDGLGGMEIEAARADLTVVSHVGPLGPSASPQILRLAGPDIKTVRFKSPNGKGYLVRLCCLPQ